MRPFFLRILLLSTLLCTSLPVAAQAQEPTPSFDGKPEQHVIRPAGSSVLSFSNGYLSAPTQTARPFTHLLVRRVATVPDGATITMYLRASTDGASWSPWREVRQSDDLWVPSDGPEVWWSDILTIGEVARYWQVRADYTNSPSGGMPLLKQVEVNTVDTRLSPEQEAAQRTNVSGGPSILGAEKPFVVSRTAWGSPDGQSSRAEPEYRPVTHLIVHHTADSGTLYASEANWAARVRAYWTFHAITRGWGDIGYNYLIDPNGVIYEGRGGGDGAVGFHDTANYGSMGVSIIGTYTKAGPSQASQDSLVRLLGWKAKERGINPLGAGYYEGCARSKYCYTKANPDYIPTIAGHRQVTPGHTTCPGDAFMALMPSIRNRVKALIEGDPVGIAPNIELLGVSVDKTTVASGEFVKFTFTIKNTGATTIRTQSPQAGTIDGYVFNDARDGRIDDSYTYDEGECYLGDGTNKYPAYPKETGRFRVVLGPTNRNVACAGGTSGFAWRWGLNGDLAPGETRTISGYVRFRELGVVELRAGIVQENVRYFKEDFPVQSVTVAPEQTAPEVVALDGFLRAQANVYALSNVPANFLERTANARSIVRGRFLGSFAWNGATIDWRDGGPLGQTERFIVEQTRSFLAPVSGEYTFRTTSDDGSWLWVDGQLVVSNQGLHGTEEPQIGRMWLGAGVHTVSFKYFEYDGFASAGYDMRLPRSDQFVVLPDATGGNALVLGNTYVQNPSIVISVDDLGGDGVAQIGCILNGADCPGSATNSVWQLGKLQNGSYTLRYWAVDRQGNRSAERSTSFTVDTNRTVYTRYAPLISR